MTHSPRTDVDRHGGLSAVTATSVNRHDGAMGERTQLDPAIDRRQFLSLATILGVGGLRFGIDDVGLMSFAEERRLGDDLFKELLTSVTVSKDRKRTAAIERIFQRITSLSSIPKGRWGWKILLVEEEAINAVAYPGGKIVVTTGIDGFANRDVDELAVIIGHEVGHITERHAAKQIRNANIAKGIESRITGALGRLDATKRAEILQVIEAGTLVGAGLPYGRRQESAADEVGLRYADKAGYKASDALNFWNRMDRSGTQNPPAFLSTHPSDQDRIARITEELKKL